MTKRKAVIGILFISVCIASLLCFYFINLPDDKEKNPYNAEIFESGKGWGYKIKKEEKVIIYQPNMPCVNNDIPFPDQTSAMNTANLVLNKINMNENPSISFEELDKIVNIKQLDMN